jgi:hypothetical protein
MGGTKLCSSYSLEILRNALYYLCRSLGWSKLIRLLAMNPIKLLLTTDRFGCLIAVPPFLWGDMYCVRVLRLSGF